MDYIDYLFVCSQAVVKGVIIKLGISYEVANHKVPYDCLEWFFYVGVNLS